MNLSSLSPDTGKLILRLSVGLLMLFHGVAKIINPDSVTSIKARLIDAGIPSIITYGVFLGEIVAPLMIIIGIFARIGGLFIVGNMLFAIYLAHSGDIFLLSRHGGWRIELQGFYLFCGLAIIFLGSGKYAARPD